MRNYIRPIIGIIVIIIIGMIVIPKIIPSGPEQNYMSAEPVPPTGLSNVKMVAAGKEHAMAIDAQGSLFTWGQNDSGQLGTGNNRLRRLPVKIMEGTVFTSVAAGDEHSLAIDADGNLWAWGNGKNGQNGGGGILGYSNTNKPAMMDLENVVSISAGGSHSAAVTADGRLWMWGYNNYNQLGDDKGVTTNTPRHIMDDVSAVSAGFLHTAALKKDGSMWLWGMHGTRERAEGESASAQLAVTRAEIDNVTMISAGNGYTLALKSDGSVWSLGRSGLNFIMDNAVSVWAGRNQNFAIDQSGNLWAWRSTSSAQLSTPAMVLNGIASAAAGELFSLAVKKDGGALAWGNNAVGQLGNALEDVREDSVAQIVGDILGWLWTICESSLFILMIVYGLLARILPEPMIFSGEHALWHNIIIGIVWIGLFLTLSIFYLIFAIRRVVALHESAESKCDCNVYPIWHGVFYGFAALVVPLVSYFELSKNMYWLMVPLIAIPQLYLLICGKVIRYPRLLLSQVALIALLVIGFYLFTVVVYIVAVIVGMAAGGAVISKGGDQMFTCDNCGRKISETSGYCKRCHAQQ